MNFSNNNKQNLVIIILSITLVIVLSLFGFFIYSQNSRNNNFASSNKQNEATNNISDKKDSETQNKNTPATPENKNTQPNVQNSFNIVVPPPEKQIVIQNTPNIKNSDFIFPDSSSVKLNGQQLSNFSKQTLAMARNEIYARHGYMFKSEPFKSYFNNKSWYTPNPNFKESDLNNIEVYNIALFLKYEK